MHTQHIHKHSYNTEYTDSLFQHLSVLVTPIEQLPEGMRRRFTGHPRNLAAIREYNLNSNT